MSLPNAVLNFATQGDNYSYHARAAELAARDVPFTISPCEEFYQVVGKSRSTEPGLGVIAVHNTLSGVVVNAAKQLIRFRPSEIPPIVARVDLQVSLGLMGSQPQNLGDLNREGVVCLGQMPALDQCRGFMKQFLPEVKLVEAKESTKAIKDMIAADSADVVAIGPTFAAAGLGAVSLHPEQLNPVGGETSFFILQRDPTLSLLPTQPEKDQPVTVMSVGFPEGEGEKEKVLGAAEMLGLPVVRAIDFAQGDFTRDADLKKRAGGIFDISIGRYDEEMYHFCKEVNNLKTNDGRTGPFTAKVLGGYNWSI